MRLGTPGFVGDRLEQAREARGLSAVALSEMLRVSPQAISHYEQGKHSPNPEVMETIASTLKFPRSFFLRPVLPRSAAPIFWRSKLGALKTARRRAEARLLWLDEVIVFFQQFFDFPNANLPDIGVDHREMSMVDVEAAATLCRTLWKLGSGPVPNVCAALEANGIIVARVRFGADGLDAFSQWPTESQTPRVFLGSDAQNAFRSRFDAAHELAHLVLHRNLDTKCFNSSSEFKFLENQAHRFASAFLLPAEPFAKELWSASIDSMLNIKERWGCSVAAMIKRCESLGMLDGEQARRAWINYVRRGWRNGEPMDDRVAIESPTMLRKGFDMLVSEGGLPRQQIISQLRLDADDVEELANLPNGYFSDRPEEAQRFGLRMRRSGPIDERLGADVIDLATRRNA